MRRRSNESKRRRQRLFLYSIPLIALALLLGVYYVATASPQPREDFTIPFAIQITQLSGGSGYLSNALPVGVGVSGLIWDSHQYDSEGLNGHYPLFGQEAPGGNTSYALIHVRSTVNRVYTLQDFFNVWGQPLGPNNTFGLTTPPPSSQNSLYGSDWYWDMCVQFAGGRIVKGLWGNQTLVPSEGIVLKYSNYGCQQYS